ncbi:CPBP family intramembrane metalloprotease [Nocardiopsis gilva YIM 90087]|uniref:CPBP family intramembrane metalloprotease n=1 Tax=Nocardiopsis gilva YIM 90087 TaxID=1235441 RepID=A0A223S4Y0_9ACTN|nr:CPBP family intramembrane glutamic endopeptidase [Nocardiopsis gilva]ASU83175.1 CPBP family intramembrane metalloprotease [Nocardiopsis gilva YIM 90087]
MLNKLKTAIGPAAEAHPFIAAGASGRRVTHPLLVIVLAQVLYVIGLLPSLFLIGPLLEWIPQISGSNLVVAALVGIARPIVGFLPFYAVLWLWLRFYERRTFSSTGFAFDRTLVTGLLAGFALAVAFVAALIGVGLAAGTVRWHGAVIFGQEGAAVVLLFALVFTVAKVVEIGIEEQLYRGWMLQAVGARWGKAAGVLVSSFFFALFHFFFIGYFVLPGLRSHEAHWVLMLNIFLWAVFAALVTLRTRSLWTAVGFHAAALTIPVLLLTLATPDTVDGAAGLLVFVIENPSHYTGGVGFAGPFEGLAATVVLLVLVAVAAVLEWRSSRRTDRQCGQTARALPSGALRTVGSPRSEQRRPRASS